MQRLITTCLSALMLAACSSDADGYKLATPLTAQFQKEVYPILLRDCAFPTCHGAPERFFRVWGPGRVRLDPNAPLFDNIVDPATGEPKAQEANSLELNRTLDSAIGFVDAKDPPRSLFLRKPLSAEAGGSGHLGVDRFGRNIYRSIDSEGYLVLSRWVFSLQTE